MEEDLVVLPARIYVYFCNVDVKGCLFCKAMCHDCSIILSRHVNIMSLILNMTSTIMDFQMI
jgi:hypothetical protein